MNNIKIVEVELLVSEKYDETLYEMLVSPGVTVNKISRVDKISELLLDGKTLIVGTEVKTFLKYETIICREYEVPTHSEPSDKDGSFGQLIPGYKFYIPVDVYEKRFDALFGSAPRGCNSDSSKYSIPELMIAHVISADKEVNIDVSFKLKLTNLLESERDDLLDSLENIINKLVGDDFNPNNEYNPSDFILELPENSVNRGIEVSISQIDFR